MSSASRAPEERSGGSHEGAQDGPHDWFSSMGILHGAERSVRTVAPALRRRRHPGMSPRCPGGGRPPLRTPRSRGFGDATIVAAPTGMESCLRSPSLRDGPRIWELVRYSSGLDLNSPYSYLLLCRHFSETCLVAESGGILQGFVTGYIPPGQPDTIFVWQIAVAPTCRRSGVGRRLLDALLDRLLQLGVRFMEATVTPTNEASRRLFRAVADGRGAGFRECSFFDRGLFPSGNGGISPHEPEVLLRLGPFDRPTP